MDIYKKRVEQILNETNNWAEKTTVEHEKLLLDLTKALNINRKTREGQRELLEHLTVQVEKLEEGESFEEYQKYVTLLSACIILYFVSEFHVLSPGDPRRLDNFYLIGRAIGAAEMVDPTLLPVKLFEKHFHRNKSAKYVNKKRWDKYKKQKEKDKEEVRKIAEEEYAKSYANWHNEWAHQKIKKAKMDKEDSPFLRLHEKEVRKIAGDVAYPYGWKRGDPKKDKEDK